MALSDKRAKELALQISARAKQLVEAGLVQESPAEDMDPGEWLAHMVAARVGRRKAKVASWQGTNVIDATARFKSGAK